MEAKDNPIISKAGLGYLHHQKSLQLLPRPPLIPTRNESTAPFSHYNRVRDHTSCVTTVFSSKSFLLALRSPQWAFGEPVCGERVRSGGGFKAPSVVSRECPFVFNDVAAVHLAH